MGKTLMGRTTRKNNVSMLLPGQQEILSGLLSDLGPQAQETFGGLLQPMGPEQMEETFQRTYVQPAMQTFQEQIVPGIQQRFVDANAGSSSALNQALSQSAGNLSTALGTQYGQFQQGEQQRQLQAINQFLPLVTGGTFTPVMQQQQGLVGPLLQALASLGSGFAMSSKEVKENIRSYDKGLDDLYNLDVKQYDYKEEVGGGKDKVGIIAEYLPKELTAKKAGIHDVDLYGLMGLMINAIKEMHEKILDLEVN